MLGRTVYKGNIHPQLEGVKNCRATMEIKVVVLQQARNRPTSRFN